MSVGGDAIIWCNALTEYQNSLRGRAFGPAYKYQNEIIRDADFANTYHTDIVHSGNVGFRLLTTDEWEGAARYRNDDGSHGAIEYPLGSGTYWTPGDYASGAKAYYNNASATRSVAWYSTNSGGKTQAVGQKPAKGNALGLYDMCGNVWEWCYDNCGSLRARRGGAFYVNAISTRVGNVNLKAPSGQRTHTGFRFVRTAD